MSLADSYGQKWPRNLVTTRGDSGAASPVLIFGAGYTFQRFGNTDIDINGFQRLRNTDIDINCFQRLRNTDFYPSSFQILGNTNINTKCF